MADDELAQIRAARLQQLKQQQGANSTDGNEDDQQRKQEAETRSTILNQILEPAAADRLGRIRLVKESRANDVENRLIMLARSGQLRAKVTEDQLKDMLASLTEHENKSTRASEQIQVVRRGRWDDDDDLDDLLNES